MNNKVYFTAILIAVVIAIGGYFFPKNRTIIETIIETVGDAGETLGAIGTRFPSGISVGGGAPSPNVNAFIVGSTTPAQTLAIGKGRCNLRTDSDGVITRTFAASTTKMHYCTALGVRPGDQVFVTLPSSSTDASNASSSPLSGLALNGSISVVGAVSTSSDLIGVLLYNSTGVASSSYPVATTSISYLFFR